MFVKRKEDAEMIIPGRSKVDPSSEKNTTVSLEIDTQLLFMLVDKAEEEGKTIDEWVTLAICEKLFT